MSNFGKCLFTLTAAPHVWFYMTHTHIHKEESIYSGIYLQEVICVRI